VTRAPSVHLVPCGMCRNVHLVLAGEDETPVVEVVLDRKEALILAESLLAFAMPEDAPKAMPN
jgi:cytidine deaminase